MTEEAEAIGWYQQRMELEADAQARAIMENAQSEEFKHFGMDLESLLRRTPKWRVALQTILFSEGDIVEAGEKAEDAEGSESTAPQGKQRNPAVRVSERKQWQPGDVTRLTASKAALMSSGSTRKRRTHGA
jgi:hypothetical protein